MTTELEDIIQDLETLYYPANDDAYSKLNCSVLAGQKVAWYYKDDAAFVNETGGDPRKYTDWRGIIIPRHEIEYRGGELEVEDAFLVMTSHPCEKCYPITGWMSLGRLLDNIALVEIFNDDAEGRA